MEAGLGQGLEGEQADADADECPVEGEEELVKARECHLQQRHVSAATAAGEGRGRSATPAVKGEVDGLLFENLRVMSGRVEIRSG